MFYAIAVTAVVICTASETPLFEEQLIFPGESMHCHSSTIVETPEGDLLAAWFYGHGEKGDDTLVINGARRKKGDTAWSKPFLMADSDSLPDQNPVLFIDPRGTLWLFYICSLDNTYDTYLVKYKTSKDYAGEGAPIWESEQVLHARPQEFERLFLSDLWANAADYAAMLAAKPKYPRWIEDAKHKALEKLNQRIGWMTRTHPIMLDERTIMLPLYSDAFACSLAVFTSDWGRSWTSSQPILNLNVQASFARRSNGDIVAYMRDRSALRKMPMSVSTDGGKTWSAASPTTMANPDSSVVVLPLPSGKWLLVCNDTDGTGPRGGRNQLSAFLSGDEGATWPWSRHLEKHDESCAASYPSVSLSADGTIHCTYTYSPTPHETIKYVRFNEAWVMEGNH